MNRLLRVQYGDTYIQIDIDDVEGIGLVKEFFDFIIKTFTKPEKQAGIDAP